MTHTCHRCTAVLEIGERVGRRDACPRCGADLHCCRNCAFHSPGAHNDCREPLAERQVDKERANFCEYFAYAERRAEHAAAGGAARAALDRLFADRKRR
jgi:predicted  nucleic acid-binding Zn-ribbon protein